MDNAIPKSIGKYPVIRVLGQGATSRVYLAYDMFRSQQVAIKVMQTTSILSDGARRLAQRLRMQRHARRTRRWRACCRAATRSST